MDTTTLFVLFAVIVVSVIGIYLVFVMKPSSDGNSKSGARRLRRNTIIKQHTNPLIALQQQKEEEKLKKKEAKEERRKARLIKNQVNNNNNNSDVTLTKLE